MLCNARGQVDQYLVLWISNSYWKHYLKWLCICEKALDPLRKERFRCPGR